MSDQSSDHWVSAQLRRVPLPEGLLDQLRAIARQSDEELDAFLCDVPVPAGLVGRLEQIVADERLDRQIADVPVPTDLRADLRCVPENEMLDETIRRVPAPMPVRVLRTLSAIPDRSRRWQHLWHLATAASLLLTISISYFLTMFGLMADAYRPVEDEVLVVHFGDAPINLLALAPVSVELVVPDSEPARSQAEDPELGIDFIAMRLSDEPSLREEVLAPFSGRYDAMDDVHLIGWQPLGSPHRADDDLPELQAVAEPRPSGIAPPMDRGYDRAFLLRYGVHPPVSPGAGGDLASRTVPLSAATDSYDRAERVIAQRWMPEPGDIRHEDFLAAMDYQFPLPPPGQLGIRTAAGPSVFGEAGAQLLQVGVQAGRPARRITKATHLTVAVDVSASMRWSGRVDSARRGLRRFVQYLEDGDRLSLVRFHEEAYLDKEFKGPEQADELLAAIEWMQPAGGTNLGAGLQLAASVAMRHPTDEGVTPGLVLITDGVSGLPKSEVSGMEELLAQVSGQGVQLTVIDLSRGDAEDPLLARLARAAGGAIVKAASAEEIRWLLVETLTGGSSLVADDAVLTVTFNPETVAAYRLIGHAPAVAGLMPQGAETPLRSRQAATALFEVWLKPGGSDDVAVAEVEWRDSVTGQAQRRGQRISRLQFATSLAEAPLSLQAATIASETSEVLGESYFVASKSRGLKDVIALAREVNPRLASRSSFQRFAAFVERAERTRARRGSGQR